MFVLLENSSSLEAEFLSPLVKLLPVLFSLLGTILTYIYIEFSTLIFTFISRKVPSSLFNIYFYFSRVLLGVCSFFYNAGYFNSIYNYLYLKFYQFSYFYSTKTIDKGYLEFLGPFGMYLFFRNLSLTFLSLPSSLFFNIFLMFACFCILVLFVLLSSGVFLLNDFSIVILSFFYSLLLLNK